MAIVLAIAALIVLFLPDSAFAWGAPAHLEMGQHVLHNLHAVAPAVRAVIERFPYDYLYGNITADIVVGKNLMEELKHCHNWKVGFKLLKKTRDGAERAFAYGYLSHLAADTVAHNHFIPEMMIRSFSSKTHRHIYWELRYDAFVDKSIWQLPKKMVKMVDPRNDALLEAVTEDAPLSFTTNKRIFSSFMSLSRFRQWHRMLSVLSSASRWSLGMDEREFYFNCSVEAVMDLLNHGPKAACVRKDPTGKHSLTVAKHMRKKLIDYKRSGRDWHEAVENAVKTVRV